jgi:PKD repeat protein
MGKVAGITAIIGSLVGVLTFYYSVYLPYVEGGDAPVAPSISPVINNVLPTSSAPPEPEPLSVSLDTECTSDTALPATFQITAMVAGGTTPYIYDWDIDGEDCKNTHNVLSHTFSDTGSYDGVVTVTDAKGQTARDSMTFRVVEPEMVPEEDEKVHPSARGAYCT